MYKPGIYSLLKKNYPGPYVYSNLNEVNKVNKEIVLFINRARDIKNNIYLPCKYNEHKIEIIDLSLYKKRRYQNLLVY